MLLSISLHLAHRTAPFVLVIKFLFSRKLLKALVDLYYIPLLFYQFEVKSLEVIQFLNILEKLCMPDNLKVKVSILEIRISLTLLTHEKESVIQTFTIFILWNHIDCLFNFLVISFKSFKVNRGLIIFSKYVCHTIFMIECVKKDLKGRIFKIILTIRIKKIIKLFWVI